LIEFLSRGANPNGCEANKLVSWYYLSFTLPKLVLICRNLIIYSNHFTKILEILYIYGIEFDWGNTFLDQSNFASKEEYDEYRVMSICEEYSGSQLYWMDDLFEELCYNDCFSNESCYNECSNESCSNELRPDSNFVLNILYIFILYYSDKYDIDFSSNEFVNQYLTNQLKSEIYYFIIKYNSEKIKIKSFINQIEKKMKFLMYIMHNRKLYSLLLHHFIIDMICLYL
jgi:hypothetical protein